MKSAGKRSRKRSSFSNGAWYCANGIAPESNHTSMTSGTRFIVPRALRAREVDVVDVRAVRVLEPHAAELLELVERADARACGRSSQRQTGSGVPQ